MEKKLRAKLEEELKELRTQQQNKEGRETSIEQEDTEALVRKLSEYEEKVVFCSCILVPYFSVPHLS